MVTGRKRHIVVDTVSLHLAVAVHAANTQDRDDAKLAPAEMLGNLPRLQVIRFDVGDVGQRVARTWVAGRQLLTVALRKFDSHRFQVLPKR